MKVYKLTIEQKDSLIGQNYKSLSQFNPIEDNNGDWVISVEEVDNCTNVSYQWVKTLPLINYEPIQEDVFEMSPMFEKPSNIFTSITKGFKNIWKNFKNIF